METRSFKLVRNKPTGPGAPPSRALSFIFNQTPDKGNTYNVTVVDEEAIFREEKVYEIKNPKLISDESDLKHPIDFYRCNLYLIDVNNDVNDLGLITEKETKVLLQDGRVDNLFNEMIAKENLSVAQFVFNSKYLEQFQSFAEKIPSTSISSPPPGSIDLMPRTRTILQEDEKPKKTDGFFTDYSSWGDTFEEQARNFLRHANKIYHETGASLIGVPVKVKRPLALHIRHTYKKHQWQTGINIDESEIAFHIEKLLTEDAEFQRLQSHIEFLPLTVSGPDKDMAGKPKEEWVNYDLYKMEEFIKKGGALVGWKNADDDYGIHRNVTDPLFPLINNKMKKFNHDYPSHYKEKFYLDDLEKLLIALEDDDVLRSWPFKCIRVNELDPKDVNDAFTKEQKQLLIVELILKINIYNRKDINENQKKQEFDDFKLMYFPRRSSPNFIKEVQDLIVLTKTHPLFTHHIKYLTKPALKDRFMTKTPEGRTKSDFIFITGNTNIDLSKGPSEEMTDLFDVTCHISLNNKNPFDFIYGIADGCGHPMHDDRLITNLHNMTNFVVTKAAEMIIEKNEPAALEKFFNDAEQTGFVMQLDQLAKENKDWTSETGGLARTTLTMGRGFSIEGDEKHYEFVGISHGKTTLVAIDTETGELEVLTSVVPAVRKKSDRTDGFPRLEQYKNEQPQVIRRTLKSTQHVVGMTDGIYDYLPCKRFDVGDENTTVVSLDTEQINQLFAADKTLEQAPINAYLLKLQKTVLDNMDTEIKNNLLQMEKMQKVVDEYTSIMNEHFVGTKNYELMKVEEIILDIFNDKEIVDGQMTLTTDDFFSKIKKRIKPLVQSEIEQHPENENDIITQEINITINNIINRIIELNNKVVNPNINWIENNQRFIDIYREINKLFLKENASKEVKISLKDLKLDHQEVKKDLKLKDQEVENDSELDRLAWFKNCLKRKEQDKLIQAFCQHEVGDLVNGIKNLRYVGDDATMSTPTFVALPTLTPKVTRAQKKDAVDLSAQVPHQLKREKLVIERREKDNVSTLSPNSAIPSAELLPDAKVNPLKPIESSLDKKQKRKKQKSRKQVLSPEQYAQQRAKQKTKEDYDFLQNKFKTTYRDLLNDYVLNHYENKFKQFTMGLTAIQNSIRGVKNFETYDKRTNKASSIRYRLANDPACDAFEEIEKLVVDAKNYRDSHLKGSKFEKSDLINIISAMEYDLKNLSEANRKVKVLEQDHQQSEIPVDNRNRDELLELFKRSLRQGLGIVAPGNISANRLLNIKADTLEDWLLIIQAERKNITNSANLEVVLREIVADAKDYNVPASVNSDLRNFVQPFVDALLKYINDRETSFSMLWKDEKDPAYISLRNRLIKAGELAHDLLKCKSLKALEAILEDAWIYQDMIKTESKNSKLITILNKLQEQGDSFISDHYQPKTREGIHVADIEIQPGLFEEGEILKENGSFAIMAARQSAIVFAMSQSKDGKIRQDGFQLIEKNPPETIEYYRRELPVIFYAQLYLFSLKDLEVGFHEVAKSQIENKLKEFLTRPDASLKELRDYLQQQFDNIAKKEKGFFDSKSTLGLSLNQFLAKVLPRDEVIEIMETKKRETEVQLPNPLTEGKTVNSLADLIERRYVRDLSCIITFFNIYKKGNTPITWREFQMNPSFSKNIKDILLKFLNDYNKNDESQLIKYSEKTLAILSILKDSVPNKINGYEIKNKLNQLYYQTLDLRMKQFNDYKAYDNFLKSLNRNKKGIMKGIKDREIATETYNKTEIKLENALRKVQPIDKNEVSKIFSESGDTNTLTRVQVENYSKNNVRVLIKDKLSNEATQKLNNMYRTDDLAPATLEGIGVSSDLIKKLTRFQLFKYAAAIREAKEESAEMITKLFDKDKKLHNIFSEDPSLIAQGKFFNEVEFKIKQIIKPLIANDILINDLQVEKIIANQLKAMQEKPGPFEDDEVNDAKNVLLGCGFNNKEIDRLKPGQLIKYADVINHANQILNEKLNSLKDGNNLHTDYADPIFADAIDKIKKDQFGEVIGQKIKEILENNTSRYKNAHVLFPSKDARRATITTTEVAENVSIDQGHQQKPPGMKQSGGTDSS